jgi:hypothetical protein
VIGLYYYGEVTMKEIGAEIGVNESRVSQLHARAIRRLRDALGEMGPQHVVEMRNALVAFAAKKPVMAKAALAKPASQPVQVVAAASAHPAKATAVVLPYAVATKRRTPVRATLKAPRTRQAVAAAR